MRRSRALLLVGNKHDGGREMAVGKRVVGRRKSVEGGEREITACLCWLLQGKAAVFGMGGERD